MKKYIYIVVALLTGMLATGCSDSEAEPSVSSGTVQLGDVTISIPEGALDGSAKLTAQVMDQEAQPSPLGGFVGGVQLGPSGTVFQKPVQVTIPIDSVGANAKLAVYYWNEREDCWESAGKATLAGDKASFQVTHFSKYAVVDLVLQGGLFVMGEHIGDSPDISSSLDAVVQLCKSTALADFSYIYDSGTALYMANSLRYDIRYVDTGAEKSLGSVHVARPAEAKLPGEKGLSYSTTYLAPGKGVIDGSGKTLAQIYTTYGPFITLTESVVVGEPTPDITCESEKGKLEKKGDKVVLNLLATVKDSKPITVNVTTNVAGKSESDVAVVAPSGVSLPLRKAVLQCATDYPTLQLEKDQVTTDKKGKVKVTVKATGDNFKGTLFVYSISSYNSGGLYKKEFCSEDFWEMTLDFTHSQLGDVSVDRHYTYKVTFDMNKFAKSDLYQGHQVTDAIIEVTASTPQFSTTDYYDGENSPEADYKHYTYSNIRSAGTKKIQGKVYKLEVPYSDMCVYGLEVDKDWHPLGFADCVEEMHFGSIAEHKVFHGGLEFEGLISLQYMSAKREITLPLSLSLYGDYEKGQAVMSGFEIRDVQDDEDNPGHYSVPIIVGMEDVTGTLHMCRQEKK